MNITLKQKKELVNRFNTFFIKEFGVVVTNTKGEHIDVQSKLNEFVKKEFNYDKK